MNIKHTFMIAMIALLASCAPKETHLTIIETTDTHGRYDEFANDAFVLKQMKAQLGLCP